MYPPAVDLGSAAVQAWSDRELFWIIKHGIRLTGMPGFGRELGDDEIRQLVAYVRTLAETRPRRPVTDRRVRSAGLQASRT